MKKFLYIYLLLISSSVCAMKPEKKQPVNKKPFITNQEIAGMALVSIPVLHTALTPLYFIAPPLTAGMVLLGAAKVGAGAFGSALLFDANYQRQNNNKQSRS